MENELDTFEKQVLQLVQQSSRLRSENQQLRNEMTALRSVNQQYAEKLGQVKTRLEKLLASLPEKTAAPSAVDD